MNVIEEAKSGRAACRGCKEKIAKGELRYGDFDETWESYKWYHLACGAAFNPSGFSEAVGAFEGEIPDLDAVLEAAKKAGRKNTFPRAEVAPSGRSSCMQCEDKIDKGALRVVVEREIEGFGKRPGYLHPGCAAEFVGIEPAALLATLTENSGLTDEQNAELRTAVG